MLMNFRKTAVGVFGLTVFFCGLHAGDAADGAAERFKKANDLYRAGQYSEAAAQYEELAQGASPAQRAVLYFNLANSEYRAGQLNQSIWNYERALRLNPWYADARYNLDAVKAKIEYKIEDRRNPFIRFHDLILKWVSLRHLAVPAFMFCFIFLISCGFWFRNSSAQSFWMFPRAECFALFLLFTVLFGAKFFYTHQYAEAIVLTGEADVRYGPSMDNQSLMKLGGGLKVFIVDAREDWSRVVTWNGETGWMKNAEIGRVDA